MTRNLKRRIISSITSLAMVFSFGAANALDAYNSDISEPQSVKLNYDSIEELPDGGKIYVYNIGGVESSFPVPPDGFKPLDATDEQLDTYGFPPRPDKENVEDYNDWVELMQNYKSTPIPDISVNKESKSVIEDNQANAANFLGAETLAAGYVSKIEGSQFYTQAQVDYVQPTVASTSGSCANEFYISFGNPLAKPYIKTGTRNFGKNKAYAFCDYRDVFGVEEVKLGMTVNPGDKLHIYVSFQKASHRFNYYIANNTSGQAISNLVSPPVSGECFDGHYVSWCTGRVINPNNLASGFYNLGKCNNVVMSNCKAMLNTSTTWTNLSNLSELQRIAIYDSGGDHKQLYRAGSITNGNSFSLIWMAYD